MQIKVNKLTVEAELSDFKPIGGRVSDNDSVTVFAFKGYFDSDSVEMAIKIARGRSGMATFLGWPFFVRYASHYRDGKYIGPQ